MQIKRDLPKHFESLVEVFNDLPFEPDFVLPYPFTKLVVNLGAQTEGHTDPTDYMICLIVPFGEWEGGAVGLVHAGVVVELRQGDGIAFPSDKMPHFNEMVSGLRGSLVMATDKNLRTWRETRNHWGHAVY